MHPDLAHRLRAHHAYLRLKSQASYRSELRAAVRALWTGIWDLEQFFNAFDAAIQREFERAWAEGMRSVGLTLEDMTADERNALDRMKIEERQFIFPFGTDIEAANQEAGGQLGMHMARVEKWINRYNNVRNQAMQMAKNDPVLEWVTHAAESCISCLKLNGQRRRSSVWARLDLRPQHPTRLECMRSAGGVDVCKCTFNPTDQPPSRGRLPKV